MRIRWMVVAAATVLLIGLPASAAQAAGVPVPLHRAPWVNLGLIAGSDAGFAVGMAQPIEITTQSVLIGAPGTLLREHVLTTSATARISWLNMVGQQAGYVIARSRTATKYEMHQLNVVTGADTNLGTVGQLPFAYTADSWIGLAGNYLISTPFTGGAATRIAPLDGTRPSSYRTTDGAMLIRRFNADRSQSYLDLVDFAGQSVRRVATEKSIVNFSISPTAIAWASDPPQTGKPMTVKVLARSGGTPFVYSETNRGADILAMAAGDNSFGYVINRSGVSQLRTIGASGLVSTVPLPFFTSNLVADGSGWLISVSGRMADAGVYSVQGSTVDRQATVTGPHVPTVGLSFAAGRLYYTDDSNVDDGAPLGERGPMPVWSRPVNELGSPKLGNESELTQRTAHLPAGSDHSMAFSAGRGVVSGVVTRTRFTWRLLDRGRTTAIVHQPYTYQETGLADARYAPASGPDQRYPNPSGPYLLAAGHVFNPAGREIYARPGAADGKKAPASGTDDLFGPRLVYTRPVHGSDIWLRDLDRPRSPSNPVKIAHTNRSGTAVAIWGNTVAWQSGARQISLRTLNSKKIRRIPTNASLYELTLGEGTLAWTSRQQTYLLDTRSADSHPVALAGHGSTIRLDDHNLARRVSSGNVVAYRNPFTNAYHPRLIGTFAPLSFIAPGSWNPQFDLTKPVKDVRLVIRSAKTGSTLRTLVGTGPDGSIRDLVFDGRNAKGKVLADGTYRWRLLASAKDGDGVLIGIRGEKQVTGTVTIQRGIVKR